MVEVYQVSPNRFVWAARPGPKSRRIYGQHEYPTFAAAQAAALAAIGGSDRRQRPHWRPRQRPWKKEHNSTIVIR